ncbi:MULTISPECIES: putative FMN-dependent luciferase-like monooxygenase [Brenneria]|uniref:FMN-dependent luciferase-like monooxygenase n=1 Tax=Brenneria nigrifluens DSM 30175 = ATCC 13028 TaxID=1121120 RepID=A0A2U1UQR3_9GAMM|nr:MULTISPECIES: putative FMN-dependent luciferase-like monooxygenase [Brenneria]EHD23696.1 Luciferase-like, subgroup [Brenneria sp. EniD312]PWC23944.1 putative FMN-dependent luciferase-like monooxygenase [Brenneria nigrifluens DSM 30175 = ATCC 13028]QCR06615.1 putative FMN-dependent luciferase-like monooxygenase [Brenneria nigrifluens DSM 30175 = ATCC 13028]
MTSKRLGFFTRLLDDVSAQQRYRLATEQIIKAEQLGFDSAWVAQHHFHADEGGLPSPLVFLAHVAANTRRIRLGTGVITLPMEHPLRVAEDTAVLDLLSNGRLEVGIGSGGTPSSFAAFGHDSTQRGEILARYLAQVRAAWSGEQLSGDGNQLYPEAAHLNQRVWQATFSVDGAVRAGKAGDGLMLSRTQPRPESFPDATLADLQNQMIDAYLAALPEGVQPRILGSRSVFVADDRQLALSLAEKGLRRSAARLGAFRPIRQGSVAELIDSFDSHVGTAEDVIASLQADSSLARVTDLSFQVHSIDPPHALILRSLELIATQVAPALGWQPAVKQKNPLGQETI